MKKIRFVTLFLAFILLFGQIAASAGAASFSSYDSIFYPPVYTAYPTPTPTPAPTPTPISDVFLRELDGLMEAAYKNKTDIRDRVKKLVSTYNPANPAVTVVKDGKYRELMREDYGQTSLFPDENKE